MDRTEKAIHLYCVFLYCLAASFSYLLMLASMTFNLGLFLAVIFGLSLGNYWFGSMRSQDNEEGNHCMGG